MAAIIIISTNFYNISEIHECVFCFLQYTVISELCVLECTESLKLFFCDIYLLILYFIVHQVKIYIIMYIVLYNLSSYIYFIFLILSTIFILKL